MPPTGPVLLVEVGARIFAAGRCISCQMALRPLPYLLLLLFMKGYLTVYMSACPSPIVHLLSIPHKMAKAEDLQNTPTVVANEGYVSGDYCLILYLTITLVLSGLLMR